MKTSEHISCTTFPCQDIDKTKYITPQTEITPETIQMIRISEAAPQKHSDYYYTGEDAKR